MTADWRAHPESCVCGAQSVMQDVAQQFESFAVSYFPMVVVLFSFCVRRELRSALTSPSSPARKVSRMLIGLAQVIRQFSSNLPARGALAGKAEIGEGCKCLAVRRLTASIGGACLLLPSP